MVHRLQYNSCDPDDSVQALRALCITRQRNGGAVAVETSGIVNDVAQRGDLALREYTQKFDRHAADTLRLSVDQIASAAADCPDDVRQALVFSAERIRDFHRRSMPGDLEHRDQTGVRMGYRYRPMTAVGLYVPGGIAAYPSSVLMNVIPAQVAGVGRIVLCTPTPDQYYNPAVMAAIQTLGVKEVYAVGGAQAISAMAYGTSTMDAVDFIAGPGNAYVTAAKKHVFGQVGIDSLAGPSEVTIVADSSARPSWLAADLLAQSEHDQLAQSILITDDVALAEATLAAVDDMLKELPRADVASASWHDNGAVVVVEKLEHAAALVDVIAPEHLIIACAEPDSIFAAVQHAGSVFLGHYTPEAVGDYSTGPNHVLPTAGSARYASGLSTISFMKRTTFQQFDGDSLARVAPAAEILAHAEGLDAHAVSLRLRLGND